MLFRTIRRARPVFIVLAILAGWLSASPLFANWATDWQMCQGAKLDKFTSWDQAFAEAAIPEIDAVGWGRCPNPRIIDWSIVNPVQRGPRPATFHYFQTVLMFPVGGRSCYLRIKDVRGGLEVTIFNSKHPQGKKLARYLDDKGELAKGAIEDLDLTPHVVAGYSRLVISHNDAGAARAALRFARIEIDERIAAAKAIEIIDVKDVFFVHKRKVVYSSGGTDEEWEAKLKNAEIQAKEFGQRWVETKAARAEELRRKAEERHYQELEYQQRRISLLSLFWSTRSTSTSRWTVRYIRIR